jgi:hypothetical protein
MIRPKARKNRAFISLLFYRTSCRRFDNSLLLLRNEPKHWLGFPATPSAGYPARRGCPGLIPLAAWELAQNETLQAHVRVAIFVCSNCQVHKAYGRCPCLDAGGISQA